MVEISVLGISLQDESKTPLLLLHPHGSQALLTLEIGPMEAFAISVALHGKPGEREERGGDDGLFPRPLTHDFIVNVLRSLGVNLVGVRLTRAVGDTFIAQAELSHTGGRTSVDCRPSDGIAIALRSGAPVFASGEVTARARDINEVMAALPEHIRSIAAAKLIAAASRPASVFSDVQKIDDARGLPRIPRAVEDALSARLAATERDSRKELISVARKMIGEERAKNREDFAAGLEQLLSALEKTPARRLKIDAPMPEVTQRTDEQTVPHEGGDHRSGLRAPQIRVSIVRRAVDGKKEGAGDISAGKTVPFFEPVLAGFGLSTRETEALRNAKGDDRWAMLLRMLSPETKVLM